MRAHTPLRPGGNSFLNWKVGAPINGPIFLLKLKFYVKINKMKMVIHAALRRKGL